MSDGIFLGEELEAFINAAVRSGRFPSREAVIRESVRLLRDHDRDWDRFARDILLRIDREDTRDGGGPVEPFPRRATPYAGVLPL